MPTGITAPNKMCDEYTVLHGTKVRRVTPEIRQACRAKPKSFGLGDAVASIATPIARALRLPCIDPATKKLRPESGCAKRKANWNAKVPNVNPLAGPTSGQ
jgi:hypothetical protein